MSKATGGRTTPDEAKRIADKYVPDQKKKSAKGAKKSRPPKTGKARPEEIAPEVPAPPPAPPPPPEPEKPLTAREMQFVLEYLVDFNGTQAAIRAGYSKKTAAVIAYENLRKPHIRAAIDFELKERAKRLRWDADVVLQRLSDELTADIADLYDERGGLKPVHEWPLVFRTGLVAGIEVEELFEGRGEEREHVGTLRKIKLSDRKARIELIGKHRAVQAFKEQVELDVPEESPLLTLFRQVAGTSIRPVEKAPTPAVDPDADEDGDD